jgi:hypothetical protein
VTEQRYLGNEAFIEAAERQGRIRPERSRLRVMLEDCIRATCDVMAIDPAELRTPSRSGSAGLKVASFHRKGDGQHQLPSGHLRVRDRPRQ